MSEDQAKAYGALMGNAAKEQQYQEERVRLHGIRCLISARDAGLIIGVGGKTAQEIRDSCQVKLRMSEAVEGAKERVLFISAEKAEQIGNAVQFVSRKLLQHRLEMAKSAEEQGRRVYTPRSVLSGQPLSDSEVEVNLLIPNFYVGAVIGKGGSTIKSLQEDFGIKMMVSDSMLGHSDDRSVSFIGASDKVGLAVGRTVGIVRDAESEKKVLGNTYYQPGVDSSQYSQSSSSTPRRGRMSSGAPQTRGGPEETRDISVDSVYVGCIIGRGGKNIQHLRRKSGCQIHVENAQDGNDMVDGAASTSQKRVITIGGSPAQIDVAIQLINQKIEQEKERLATINAEGGEGN
ncbi:hypothetical protein MIR68_010644 [Amoeboaphelidium protococcarum]|nr:hypothetical protein MIR68_010644 [Amoeboaphelidium protococcarum]